MAQLPPPPIQVETQPQLKEWLNKLYRYLGGTENTIPWDQIDATGSDLTDIANRPHSDLQALTADDHTQYVLADGTRNITGQQEFEDNIVLPKTAGKGVLVDTVSPTNGWQDLLGSITIQSSAGGGGGPSAIPDFIAYRGNIYAFRFGTLAPNNHLHEAYFNYHIPHDYLPGSDLYVHIHWSQITVDTGGAAGAPGNAKWYFDITYSKGHGTPGGVADPFVAPITVSVTQQASTTQYGHMIGEVQFTNNGGTGGLLNSNNIEPDGVIIVRAYRDPADVADTLNQDTFVHYVDIHYQTTCIGTKNKSPNFYS
jgi:hypothetical protein